MSEYYQIGLSENGTIHLTMKKWVSHILFLKKGAYGILGSTEKGGFCAAHPYYVIYR